jgi:hypothetical protein
MKQNQSFGEPLQAPMAWPKEETESKETPLKKLVNVANAVVASTKLLAM